MDMITREIGTTFEVGNMKLKVVESPSGDCRSCYFRSRNKDCFNGELRGYCSKQSRMDKKDVHFELLSYEKEEEPKYILINGYEVPEPLRKAPEEGTVVYTVLITSSSTMLAEAKRYYGLSMDIDALNKGLLHLTKEAAELHAKALLSFTTITTIIKE